MLLIHKMKCHDPGSTNSKQKAVLEMCPALCAHIYSNLDLQEVNVFRSKIEVSTCNIYLHVTI